MNLFLIYLMIGVAANGLANGVFEQGKIGYNKFHVPYGQHMPQWITDPLYACAICVSGQWSLWYSVYQVVRFETFSIEIFVRCIFLILFSMGVAAFINKELE